MTRPGMGTGISILSFLLLVLLPAGASAQSMACTDCHNPAGIPPPHDSTCRNTSCLESCHATVGLGQIAHLSGTGTPITADRTTTCNNCHNPPFDGIYHPYKINVLTGSPTPAGVIDLNQACGQCHGGGTQQASATGSISSGSSVLTVDSSVGFTAGSNIRVTGAGASGDLNTSIASVPDGTTINLVGTAESSVSGAAVLQSATRNGALYRTKATLATVAKGMHNAAPVTYPVTFSTAIGSGANTLQVTATASVGCTTGCPTFTYDWDWGDTLTDIGSTQVKSHTYAGAGTYLITLTVNTSGKVVGSATRSVTVSAPDLPPTASGTCTWNADTWTVSVRDTSTDTDATGVMSVTVTWGDGGSSTGAGGATLTHTYLSAGGPYALTLKAVDTALQASTVTTLACAPAPATFTISGTVKNRTGTAPVPSASVTVKKGASAVAVKYTASDGTFSAGGLKPGTYTLTVAKVGYTFAIPAATITVGPSSSGNIINATAP